MQGQIPVPIGRWQPLSTRVFRLFLPLFFGVIGPWCVPVLAQTDPLSQYTELIMAMLTERVEEAVNLEGDMVTLSPSIPALLVDCQKLVRRSVPYYLEEEVPRFKRFEPPVRSALENLSALRVGSPPNGWTSERWTYYRVQRAIEDVLLTMAMDIGAYANSSLLTAAFSSEDLARDWSGMRAGVDEMQVNSIDPFDAGLPLDGSRLGLSGASVAGSDPGSFSGDPTMALLVRVLAGMEAILAELTSGPVLVSGGLAPGLNQGLDQGGRRGSLPGNLPDSFTVAFPEGSQALGLSAEYALNALIELMALHPQLRVIAEGHSDPTGGDRLNMALSQKRAEAVRYYVIGHGIDASRIVATHWGESKPEWGAGLDRRVVVRLLQ